MAFHPWYQRLHWSQTTHIGIPFQVAAEFRSVNLHLGIASGIARHSTLESIVWQEVHHLGPWTRVLAAIGTRRISAWGP